MNSEHFKVWISNDSVLKCWSEVIFTLDDPITIPPFTEGPVWGLDHVNTRHLNRCVIVKWFEKGLVEPFEYWMAKVPKS